MNVRPPFWAEAVLRVLLAPRDFETVSGDLLEGFRANVYPARGSCGANVWYVRQVLGFLVRGAGIWGLVFGVAVVARTALDWFAPPTDFHARATVSTALGVGILLTAGLAASWRSGSVAAGALTGAVTAALGAIISMAGAAALLTIWHDSQTMAAIRGSGGLGEVFALPLLMLFPGALLGAFGGGFGAALSRWSGKTGQSRG
jgi:hypothetical protein